MITELLKQKSTHMAKKPPKQIELPFILEGNTAPRATIRSIAKNVDGLHKIDISLIKIRPQFNARRQPEGLTDELYEMSLMIPDLADAIFASNGPAEPILGDFYKGNDHFYITNGERRFRALRHLIATGRDIYPNETSVSEVCVLLNPAGTTDLDRKRKVIATQDNLKLKPMERAYYYLSFSQEDGMTHDDIAAFLQVSRQTVDNYIMATELPKAVQDQIDTDEVKISAALTELRAQRKAAKGKKAEDEDEMTPFGATLKELKVNGDENEFEQQDNSVPGTSSIGGPKESGSGSHVVGKDSIYMNEQKTALWRQMLNRLQVVREDVASNVPSNLVDATPDEIATWAEKEVVIRMMNEYNLTVK